MTDFTNDREIMVNALQRSGHHAFILEIFQTTERYCFLNCIRDEKVYHRRYILTDPKERFLNDMNLDLGKEISGEKEKKNLIIYNTEMMSTLDARRMFDSPVLQDAVGSSRRRYFVTWLRDPLNNIASLFQTARRLTAAGKLSGPVSLQPRLHDARCLWQDHWRLIKQETSSSNEKIGLVFNRWLRDDQYRKAFYDEIDQAMPDRVSETSRWGRGSSFSRYEKGQPAPSPTELESRCDHFIDDPEYQVLFADRQFMIEVDSFFDAHPELDSLSVRWDRLRKAALRLEAPQR
jgi:hypothetical protein